MAVQTGTRVVLTSGFGKRPGEHHRYDRQTVLANVANQGRQLKVFHVARSGARPPGQPQGRAHETWRYSTLSFGATSASTSRLRTPLASLTARASSGHVELCVEG